MWQPEPPAWSACERPSEPEQCYGEIAPRGMRRLLWLLPDECVPQHGRGALLAAAAPEPMLPHLVLRRTAGRPVPSTPERRALAAWVPVRGCGGAQLQPQTPCWPQQSQCWPRQPFAAAVRA